MCEVAALKVGRLRTYTCIVLNSMEQHSGRNLKQLLTGTIIVIHSEKEAFIVKNTGNIKENLEKSSKLVPLDGNLRNSKGFIQNMQDCTVMCPQLTPSPVSLSIL